MICCTKSDCAAALSHLECFMYKKMTKSPHFDTTLPHKSVWVDVNNSAPFHDKVLATINVQKGQESRAAGAQIVKRKKRAMKCESVIKKMLRDTRNEISTFWPFWVSWRGLKWPKSSILVWAIYNRRSMRKLLTPLQGCFQTISSRFIGTSRRKSSRPCLISPDMHWQRSSLLTEISIFTEFS